MNVFKKMMLVGAAMAGTLGTANAATVVVTGNTTGQPTYTRVMAGNPPTALSSVGSNVAYQAFAFTVDQGGSYTLSLNSTFDNFLTLYQGAFDPSSALTNALVANDDGGGNLNALITRNLLIGTSYTAVATAFANGNSGTFTLTGTGPGTASFGTNVAAVPEPATWAMMLIGFGLVGASLRRRQLRSDAEFTAKMRRIAAGEPA